MTDGGTRSSKPAEIVYGVDETPPLAVTMLSGLQQVGMIAILLVFPLMLGREAGLDAQETIDLISVTMLVLGMGAILQSRRFGPVGAGYLCPPSCTAAYLGPALLAAKAGGMPLVFGMMVFSAFVESAMSRVLRPLRPYLPPELSGVVVLLIGVNVGSLGFRNLLGVDAPAAPSAAEFAVAAITLATMVGLSIWSRGAARLFCALIGMVVGYAAAAAAGLLSAQDLAKWQATPVLSFPTVATHGWAWETTLALPFLIAALGSVIRGIGDITIAQKINDRQWVRPQFGSISGGVMANGLTNLLGGILGAHPVSTSTSSVGLSAATGVTSRRVGYAIGAIFIVLAFFPKAGAVFLIMPHSVIGAATIFTAAIIFVGGMQILAARLFDQRRTFVVGLSFIVGISVDIYPAFFHGLPPQLAPIFASSLVLGTVTAVLLNLVMRIGVRRSGKMSVDPQRVDVAAIADFMARQGAVWGARRDAIERAGFNIAQAVETIADACAPTGRIEVEAGFDEFNLDVRVSYDGLALQLPTARPSDDDIMQAEDGVRRLAGFILRRNADRVSVSTSGARTTLLFHFDH